MTLFPAKGSAVIHGAMVRHGSDPAKKGVRVILALFFDEDHCNVAADFQLSLLVGVVSVLAAVALGYFLLVMEFEETAGNPLEANASILSDAEVKAGMAAAGVDLDTLDEFLNDKVPTEFDLDPSELRENDSDIDGICY